MSRGKEKRGSDRARRPAPHSRAQRRLGVESLESRAMLAGNVLVNVDSAGNLRITGDNADNQFTIIQSGNGSYLIVGQNTTINGLGSRNVTGVRRSLDIDLRGGNDDVTFTGALPGGTFAPRFTASFAVRGGAGSDTINVANVDAAGQVLIDGGGGADNLSVLSVLGDDIVLRTTLGGDSIEADGLAADDLIQIESGEGNDSLSVSNTTARRMTVNTGFGDDELVIDNTTITQSLAVNTSGIASGIGNNGRGDTGTGISGRNGQPDGQNRGGGGTGGGGGGPAPGVAADADEVQITDTFAGSATVATGGDADDVLIEDFETAGNLVVVTGDGNDILALDDVIAFGLSIELGNGNDIAALTNVAVTRRIDINAGAGNDDLALVNIAADQLFAAMGAGNDDVTAGSLVSATTRARIDGGPGADSLTGNGSIAAPLKELVGLESVI